VKTPEDGQRKFPKHVEFYSKNTFEKSVHLVGIRWAGHVVRMGEERGGGYRVLLGKPDGRKSLGRPRLRWVDNTRMDLQGMECGLMDWFGLAQDRDRWRTFMSAKMNLRVP